MSWSPLDESDPSDGGVIGDEPFDLVSDCFRKVARLFKRDWKRKPSLRELVGTVQAVLEVQLQDHTSDGKSAKLASLTFKTRKIPKRQKYAKGDVLKTEASNGEPIYARVFEIDSGLGPFVGVYDLLGILSNFPDDKQTAETALLFLQLIMRRLRVTPRPGRAAVVVPWWTLSSPSVPLSATRGGADHPLHLPAPPGPRFGAPPLEQDRRAFHPPRAEGPGRPPDPPLRRRSGACCSATV
jgi:hypothetical protein